MNREDLLKMIQDDDLDLLSIKPTNSSTMTTDERLISSFQEINRFMQEKGREPISGGDIREHQLATRLKSFREDKVKAESLSEYDEFGLLKAEQKPITSLDDIFQDDEFGLLDKADESLFRIEHVPVIVPEREDPDFIARRRPCVDFEQYESLFHQCQHDLATGNRKLIKFTSDQQIKENSFFVLNGMLLFIEKIGETYTDKYGKIDGRQRCIFENGTESEMLFRSLVKRLYEGGHAVSEVVGDAENKVFENFNVINNQDKKTGYIYILKSLTRDEKIQRLGGVYKIGFSNIPVEERVRNAINEPTYLMAPVKIVSTFECYNFNPQKLEQLLHNFFGSACLNIDIFDAKNQRHSPREWFVAPLPIIEKSIELIISGAIVNYKYNSKEEKIILR